MGMTFKREDAEETYEDYDAYTALNRQSILRKPFVPYIAAGLVALVAILGFAVYGTNSQNDTLSEDLALVQKQLEDMEFRLGNLEQASANGESLGALKEGTENLSRQLRDLEARLGQNLNQVNDRLAALEKAKAKAAAAPPAAKKTTAASQKTHVVKAGETLYQISRKYGLSVDQLKKFNNMGKDVTIRPGQKLIVAN
jgi:LysM repeat protein